MGLIRVGMDEVGRGAMAGPLVAAAVALGNAQPMPEEALLVDSKALTAEQRRGASDWIHRHADAIAVEVIGTDAINRLGMGWANRAIFARLMERIGPGYFVVDGNLRLHQLAPPGSIVMCRCGGDRTSRAVAAASIVAKVYRDRLMETLHDAYPAYGWAHNAGYATAEHRGAIRQVGPCVEHRTLYLRRVLAEKGSA